MSNFPSSRDATARKRPRLQGVVNIIRFNWNYYLVAFGGLVGGRLALASLVLPPWLRWLTVSGIAGVGYFLAASLGASLWVYDLAPLCRWEWLPRFLGAPPRRALNAHAGFDETSLSLQRLFPTTSWTVADFFDPTKCSEASIVRARQAYPAPVPFTKISPSSLPYEGNTFDAVFLLFAAHELRSAQEREAFFKELRRVLRPGGWVVLVEHFRDSVNFAVYGPGAMHFYPKHEWQRLAQQAGFCITATEHQTPFVSAFKLQA